MRDLASRLKSEVAPKPIKVVILGEGVEAAKLRAVCTTLEEALPNSRTIVVLNGSDDLTFEHISGEIEQLRQFTCTYVDLSSGIHRMIGDSSEDDDVFIPSRDRKSGEQSRVKIEPERFALFSETFELVCDAAARSPDRGQEVSDFLRGNTITWRELELELAAPRDVYLRLREQLDIKVQRSRSAAIALEHTPGAGGTTVARWAAWSLRNTYPTIILSRYTNATSELVEWLSQASNLPVLIVIERRDLSDDERDRLFRDLKGLYVRFIFLDVRRSLHPSEDGVSRFALRDPMTADEAKHLSLLQKD